MMNKKAYAIALALAMVVAVLPVFPAQTEASAGSLVWAVQPEMDFESIQYAPGYSPTGYIATRQDYYMFYVDGKTGAITGEHSATGGLRSPYQYGYYAAEDAFFYNHEYEYILESRATLDAASQGRTLSVWEVEKHGDQAYTYYEYVEGTKYAVYANGRFVSGFDYDYVVGGNAVAFVNMGGEWGYGGKYAIVGLDGAFLTDYLYDGVSALYFGFAAVRIGDTWGFVEASGETLLAPQFEDAVVIDSETAFVKQNGKFGILNVRASAAAQAPAPTPPEPAPPAPPAAGIGVLIDGMPLAFVDVQPQNVNGRILVPLRAIFEAMGAEIAFDTVTQTVTATKGDTVVVLTIGDASPTVNGVAVTLDQPGIIVDGRTLAPLRFVAEAFGGSVNWDGASQTAEISK